MIIGNHGKTRGPQVIPSPSFLQTEHNTSFKLIFIRYSNGTTNYKAVPMPA
jgi:hypothetical protein